MPKLWIKHRIVSISENTRFRWRDKLMYSLLVFFMLGGLVFPFLSFESSSKIQHPGCAFKAITHLPCPSCGYTRSIQLVKAGDWHESLLHNPFTLFYALLMLAMASLGIMSLIKKAHYNFTKEATLLIMVIIIISWVLKFIIGPAYY